MKTLKNSTQCVADTLTNVIDANRFGQVTIITKDTHGNIVETKTQPNNIVLGVRKPIIQLLAGGSSDLYAVKMLKLGTNGTLPVTTQTQLLEEIPGSEKLVGVAPAISADGLTVTFSFIYPLRDDNIDNKVIKEMGLYTGDGTMIARTVIGEYKKVPNLYFEVYWQIGYIA